MEQVVKIVEIFLQLGRSRSAHTKNLILTNPGSRVVTRFVPFLPLEKIMTQILRTQNLISKCLMNPFIILQWCSPARQPAIHACGLTSVHRREAVCLQSATNTHCTWCILLYTNVHVLTSDRWIALSVIDRHIWWNMHLNHYGRYNGLVLTQDLSIYTKCSTINTMWYR